MNRWTIEADANAGTISRHIYGHFAEHLGRCIYDGFWVGEDSPIANVRGIRTDVVEALKRLRVPNLRWPGGCFAEDYHWADGIGPRDLRPTNLNAIWGTVVETNHFGTHEYLDLCQQIGCEPYICANIAGASVREVQQWVEYVTFGGRSPMADLRRANGRAEPWKVRLWNLGNENYANGGWMRPEYYADLFRQYQTYVRSFSGNVLTKVASGHEGANTRWTETLAARCGDCMDAISYHYYCWFDMRTSSMDFGADEWFAVLKNAVATDELVARQETVLDRHDPAGGVGLFVDEWGTWYQNLPDTNAAFLNQQNTLRNALVAGVTLNILSAHCRRVKLACLAQAVNVLMAPILTRGSEMILTPTYHVFEMYKDHQDAQLLPGAMQCEDWTLDDSSIPVLSATASRGAAGRMYLTICNLHADRAQELVCDIRGCDVSAVSGRVLTGPTVAAHNTFESPEAVVPTAFDESRLSGSCLTVSVPARSVVALELA